MSKPELPRGYLGAQPKFSDFGLKMLSHTDSEIELSGNQVEIEFKMSTPVKVTGNLIQVSTLKECGDLIFTQTRGDVVSFLVQVPDAGYYKLQIYALPVTDESKTLPGVFNYLLHSKDVKKAPRPYPKQYAQWKEGCYLHKPLIISKDCIGDGIDFKVVVPNAKAVAVVVGDDWKPLDKASDDLWQGKVSGVESSISKLTLNANFGGEELKYSTLLEYTL